MRIEVKNMVCRHCVSALADLLDKQGLEPNAVGLGYAEIAADSLNAEQMEQLEAGLRDLGFELIVDPDKALVEAIKQEVLRHINADEPCSSNLSECIERAIGSDFRKASRIFSTVEGRTIERYYVQAKIEKVKELLAYGELPLAEIAYRLGYSSSAFLSRQFKQETGMTPSQFVAAGTGRRPLNEI